MASNALKISCYLLLKIFFLLIFIENEAISNTSSKQSEKQFKRKLKIPNVKVVDGDSIRIDKKKYRLFGIDAPEMDQLCQINRKSYKCGVSAKNFLKSLISGDILNCSNEDTDRYGRILTICKIGELDINSTMVKNGWAVAYKRYSDRYIKEELYAKKNKLGLWQGEFIQPEKWRRQK